MKALDARSSVLVYSYFVAVYYLFLCVSNFIELPPYFIMSSNEINNILERTAVMDKIKPPALDHLPCLLAAEVLGNQQQNFPCNSANIRKDLLNLKGLKMKALALLWEMPLENF